MIIPKWYWTLNITLSFVFLSLYYVAVKSRDNFLHELYELQCVVIPDIPFILTVWNRARCTMDAKLFCECFTAFLRFVKLSMNCWCARVFLSIGTKTMNWKKPLKSKFQSVMTIEVVLIKTQNCNISQNHKIFIIASMFCSISWSFTIL